MWICMWIDERVFALTFWFILCSNEPIVGQNCQNRGLENRSQRVIYEYNPAHAPLPAGHMHRPAQPMSRFRKTA